MNIYKCSVLAQVAVLDLFFLLELDAFEHFQHAQHRHPESAKISILKKGPLLVIDWIILVSPLFIWRADKKEYRLYLLFFQASTPYSLESESLRMDCIMSGGASPTLAINAVTNKVRHQLLSYEGLVSSVQEGPRCLNSPAVSENKASRYKRFIPADVHLRVPVVSSIIHLWSEARTYSRPACI